MVLFQKQAPADHSGDYAISSFFNFFFGEPVEPTLEQLVSIDVEVRSFAEATDDFDALKAILHSGLILIRSVLSTNWALHHCRCRIRVWSSVWAPAQAKVIARHETEYTANWLPMAASCGWKARRKIRRPALVRSRALKKQLVVLVAGRDDDVLTAVFFAIHRAWAFNPIVAPTIGCRAGLSAASVVSQGGRPAGFHGRQDLRQPVRSRFRQRSALRAVDHRICGLIRQTIALLLRTQRKDEHHVTLRHPYPKKNEASRDFNRQYLVAYVRKSGAGARPGGRRNQRAMSLIVVALGDLAGQVASHPTEARRGFSSIGIAATVGAASPEPNALMLC